eukprot:5101067-Pleurochrysis_carterae.AAC.2
MRNAPFGCAEQVREAEQPVAGAVHQHAQVRCDAGIHADFCERVREAPADVPVGKSAQSAQPSDPRAYPAAGRTGEQPRGGGGQAAYADPAAADAAEESLVVADAEPFHHRAHGADD